MQERDQLFLAELWSLLHAVFEPCRDADSDLWANVHHLRRQYRDGGIQFGSADIGWGGNSTGLGRFDDAGKDLHNAGYIIRNRTQGTRRNRFSLTLKGIEAAAKLTFTATLAESLELLPRLLQGHSGDKWEWVNESWLSGHPIECKHNWRKAFSLLQEAGVPLAVWQLCDSRCSVERHASYALTAKGKTIAAAPESLEFDFEPEDIGPILGREDFWLMVDRHQNSIRTANAKLQDIGEIPLSVSADNVRFRLRGCDTSVFPTCEERPEDERVA